MTLNIAKLRNQMAHHHFSDIEQVDEFVIRSTRCLKDQPFAIYYVDISLELPDTSEKLVNYQDRVIGKRYFDGSKSLQWSNYLYFVICDEQSHCNTFCYTKELIEQDRVYARKFVVAESDLDSAFQSPLLKSSNGLPETNILSVWMEKLIEADLDTIVLNNDDSLPSRLSLLETQTTSVQPNIKTINPIQRITGKKEPFLRSIELKTFRDFPIQRNFDFGSVNLLVGANGSGKTSLLEAIELVYCGRNKRHPEITDNYTINAGFSDGNTETATHVRPFQTFRDRNLTWYGQPEVRKNNLYLSFAQFNFLDTDAAVGLANSTAGLEDYLSKLLVGPEASKAWNEILRTLGAISDRLRQLRTREDQYKEEMRVIDTQLKDVQNIKQESDSILTRLEEMLRRLKWGVPEKDKEAHVGNLVAVLSELDALARQAIAIEGADSPVTLDGLKKHSDRIEKVCTKADADIARLEGFHKDETRLAEEYRRCQVALKLVTEVGRMVDAGVPARADELSTQQNLVTIQSRILAGFDEKYLTILARIQGGVTVEESLRTTASSRISAEKALATIKESHAKFTELRNQSLKLAQQLREIAKQLIQGSPTPEKCPLCHTQFGPGELSKHMQLGVDEHVEAQAQALLTQMREREEEAHAILVVELATGWLNQFCERANLAKTVSLQVAISQIETAKHLLEAARQRTETLKREFLTLESQNLSVAKMGELLEDLHKTGHELPDWSPETINRLCAQIEQAHTKAAENLDIQRNKTTNQQKEIEATLGIANVDTRILRTAASQYKEQRSIINSVVEKLGNMFKSLPWSGDRPLSELVVEAESIRKVAAEYQTTIGRERQAKTIFTELIKRKEQLAKQLTELNPSIERFAKAQTTLESIQNDHSLNKAMEMALKRNRAGIEAIFGHIHSPAEFSGPGKDLNTLIRKASGVEAQLSQISTGQRAAYALSIFLAQNTQLKTAPPVLLIDDPIAHVDDLNSLSFLDFLRELVVAGDRQVFFATANEKLATLFARKFDFLGQEHFRRYDLHR